MPLAALELRRPITCTLMIALLLATAGVLAQTRGAFTDERSWPDTPEAQTGRAVLEAINADEPARLRRLVEERFATELREALPLEEHVAMLRRFHKTSNGLDFYGVRRYDPPGPDNELVVVVRNKLADTWHALVLRIDPDHAITSLQFAPARPPADAPPEPPLAMAEAAVELRSFLDRLVAAEAFSGAVLLAQGDEVLFERAYGLADRNFAIPNTSDTKFNLGSMNKMFTAVAVLQLAEEGRVRLTDPIGKYLGDDWLPRDVADKITVQHLLTHTSGLGSYFNEQFETSSRLLFREIDDYQPLVRGEQPAFAPGTSWAYSNTGYLLLGAIAEKVTGGSYFACIRERIYRPAGMINSDCYDVDRVVPRLAVGYTRDELGWRANTFMHVVRGGPAGGGYSTVDDLLAFARALRSGKIVSRETAELMWTPKPASPSYGFGFALEGQTGDRIVGHSGGFPGISASLNIWLDREFTLAVLANVDDGAEIVTQKARALLGRVDDAPGDGHLKAFSAPNRSGPAP